jgi:hypothetical protein
MAFCGQTAEQDSQPVHFDGSQTQILQSSSFKTSLGQIRAQAKQFVHLSSLMDGMYISLSPTDVELNIQ